MICKRACRLHGERLRYGSGATGRLKYRCHDFTVSLLPRMSRLRGSTKKPKAKRTDGHADAQPMRNLAH